MSTFVTLKKSDSESDCVDDIEQHQPGPIFLSGKSFLLSDCQYKVQVGLLCRKIKLKKKKKKKKRKGEALPKTQKKTHYKI